MHSTERLWTPEAGAGKHLKLGPNTILTTMRHGHSIPTATISRSLIKVKRMKLATCDQQQTGDSLHYCKAAPQESRPHGQRRLSAKWCQRHRPTSERERFAPAHVTRRRVDHKADRRGRDQHHQDHGLSPLLRVPGDPLKQRHADEGAADNEEAAQGASQGSDAGLGPIRERCRPVSLAKVPEPDENCQHDQKYPEAALQDAVVDIANHLRGRKSEHCTAGDHQKAVTNTQKPFSHVDCKGYAGTGKSHDRRRSLGVMLRKAKTRRE